MNYTIRPYSDNLKEELENFREAALLESPESLTREKFNPNNPNMQVWLFFLNNKVISLSACEASFYTGDPHVAARICRYHTLKKYRSLHLNPGFKMLPLQVKWAEKRNFKVIYWTHDINGIALNSLYQHKKMIPGKKDFYLSPLFKMFKLQKNMLFKVSQKSDFLQFIYSANLEPKYKWEPATNVIKLCHDGVRVDIDKALELSKKIKYSCPN